MRESIFRFLLFPFSLFYGLGVSIRNMIYDSGLVKATTFNIPVISVGNLSIGGTGKSPHIEYLIRLLRPYLHIATLSRGYKRKSSGFRIIERNNTHHDAGDEPIVYKRKYQDIVVSVAESRSLGIPMLLSEHPEVQSILLDDAFQHRSVVPGLNILCTDFNHLFTQDFIMPVGTLREWKSAYHRADIIIITKCPSEMDEHTRQKTIAEISPLPHQHVFFSYYKYHPLYYLFDGRQRILLDTDIDVILLSAIANTEYLLSYLEPRVKAVKSMRYEDHHDFNQMDLDRLKIAYENVNNPKKVIITTEKDAVRLESFRQFIVENKLPIFVLPIEVLFHFGEKDSFNQKIKDFLLNFKV